MPHGQPRRGVVLQPAPATHLGATVGPVANASHGRLSGTATGDSGGPARLRPASAPTLNGEARWNAGRGGASGRPVIYTSWFRPDRVHPTVVVGVASMDQVQLQAHLVAGTKEPGGSGWAWTSQVPADQRQRLVAAFNSGFKFRDTTGGFYAQGRTMKPLVNGQASVVISTDGRIAIGQWGRDVGMSPNVAAVRQNLRLIIDHGRPVPGLAQNANGQWGSRNSQHEYVWRSALALDAHGRLVYVAGNKLTLVTLADALAQAGAVRGMQLDIHPDMVTFNLFRPAADGIVSTKLLPTMKRPATRYLQPDQRDFFAVTLR